MRAGEGNYYEESDLTKKRKGWGGGGGGGGGVAKIGHAKGQEDEEVLRMAKISRRAEFCAV